jgi:hypothetical protein
MYIMGTHVCDVMDHKRTSRLIGRCHPSDREDAAQEAELAKLMGEKPSKAVNRFRKSRLSVRKRNKSFISNARGDEFYAGKGGLVQL